MGTPQLGGSSSSAGHGSTMPLSPTDLDQIRGLLQAALQPRATQDDISQLQGQLNGLQQQQQQHEARLAAVERSQADTPAFEQNEADIEAAARAGPLPGLYVGKKVYLEPPSFEEFLETRYWEDDEDRSDVESLRAESEKFCRTYNDDDFSAEYEKYAAQSSWPPDYDFDDEDE